MELIDKYSLVGADGLFSKRGCHGNCNNCSLWSEEGCRVILEAPTVDAVEVMHGRWIAEHEESVRCSECCFNRASIKTPMDYCPNCGAKMDGDI